MYLMVLDRAVFCFQFCSLFIWMVCYRSFLILVLVAIGVFCLLVLCVMLMILLAPFPSTLRILLDICSSYADTHGLRFSAEKTQLICFHLCQTLVCVPDIIFINVILHYSDEVTHLGHILSSDMDDRSDIIRAVKDLNHMANSLFFTFRVVDPLLNVFCSNHIVNPRHACAARVTVLGSVCLCVCLLGHISPTERLFVLKTLSHTQRAKKAKYFVGISLKRLRSRVMPRNMSEKANMLIIQTHPRSAFSA